CPSFDLCRPKPAVPRSAGGDDHHRRRRRGAAALLLPQQGVQTTRTVAVYRINFLRSGPRQRRGAFFLVPLTYETSSCRVVPGGPGGMLCRRVKKGRVGRSPGGYDETGDEGYARSEGCGRELADANGGLGMEVL